MPAVFVRVFKSCLHPGGLTSELYILVLDVLDVFFVLHRGGLHQFPKIGNLELWRKYCILQGLLFGSQLGVLSLAVQYLVNEVIFLQLGRVTAWLLAQTRGRGLGLEVGEERGGS